ncbi:MAG: hypothetical protein AAB665_03520 [Patescibacteria group bacterium]
MIILPLRRELEGYLKKRNLTKKFDKQRKLLGQNFSHPSLNVELLEPVHLRFFSFRIDKKYRAVFFFVAPGIIEITDINNHYR